MSEEITTTTTKRSGLWVGIVLAGLGVFLLLAMLIGGALISLFAVRSVSTSGPAEVIAVELPAAPVPPVPPVAPNVPVAPVPPAFTGNVNDFERQMDAYEAEMDRWAAEMDVSMDQWGADMEEQAAAYERDMEAYEARMDEWAAQMEANADRWSTQVERNADAIETRIEQRVEVAPFIQTRSVLRGGRFFGNLFAAGLVLVGLYFIKRQRDAQQAAAPVYGPEADQPNV